LAARAGKVAFLHCPSPTSFNRVSLAQEGAGEFDFDNANRRTTMSLLNG